MISNLLPIFIFIIGACFGSFLNVLGLRWISGRSITGRSHCPRCQNKLPWWQLLPLLSFIYLHARCHRCHHVISVQYPLVELISGLIALVIFTPLPASSAAFTAAIILLILSYNLLILAIIDAHTLLLPDSHIITVSLLSIALIVLRQSPTPLDALLGALAGAGSLLALWLITRGKGLGLGDVKLLIPLGALLGPSAVLVMLWLAFLFGGLLGAWLLIQKQATLKTAIPFGPFIIAAAIIILLAPKLPNYLLSLWLP